MSDRLSSASEIGRLIAALDSDADIKREAAIARLAVIGRRALDRLIALYAEPSTTREKRISILRVIEAAGDPRGVAIARAALDDGGDIGVAAAAALRALTDVSDPDGSALALDALVAAAMDGAADRRVRAAAVEALHDIGNVDSGVAALMSSFPVDAPLLEGATTDAVWREALEGHLPDDPVALRQAAAMHAASAPLSSVQKVLDVARKSEADAGTPARAAEWRALRGALHQALAIRGSNIALCDLRDTVAGADTPLPQTYVAALHAIGDASCLESIASALSRAGTDERWRHQLLAASAAILTRGKTARNDRAMKRIAARWPEAAAVLSTLSRTTPRRTNRVRT
jgi:hypothetical protein